MKRDTLSVAFDFVLQKPNGSNTAAGECDTEYGPDGCWFDFEPLWKSGWTAAATTPADPPAKRAHRDLALSEFLDPQAMLHTAVFLALPILPLSSASLLGSVSYRCIKRTPLWFACPPNHDRFIQHSINETAKRERN